MWFEVRVDRALCSGSGLCEVMDSNTFRVDDEGVSEVLLPSGSEEERAEFLEEIADCCPTGAIALERFDGGVSSEG
ncbi:ferredoxin [Actinopolyspora mortivallis]|uniref:Ferredoxin n=1 Tax=Actinopolyspora mortivallis TaxID=33906 RepID=A0A2T0GYP1_ACTMO|nr:ferredoxin [Actinopolyspora mortivallis]